MARTILIAACFVLTSTAQAHPGHGSRAFENTPLHFFEGVHLLPVVLATLAASYLIWRRMRQNNR